MRAVCVRGRHFNGRQQSGLNKNNLSDCGISLLLGGLMRGIKVPQQDFALKIPGGGGGGGGRGGGGWRGRGVEEWRDEKCKR